ncbi:MAG: GAF domain-containing sensor histidine kinase [Acidimicrobiia bacterium]|nr:GAF domain-containing sensor histidine kinase [Acidimicrobiia bacterium]NNF10887.1 GAF domain-containing sensor histidine kinase [Acidimicrobiia bacterium]NNL70081.1 GAF domain-containing sensor histidine kinase [Acidimicrobiia bacterium]
MKPFMAGPNEAARQAALDAYAIVDTAAEDAYDDITFLAAQICGTPIALVSLIDRDRQWFKSRVGIEATETSRDVAFCAHAIQRPQELFVVPDAIRDARFSDNPLVVNDPSIRFYAGAPLTTTHGHAVGTLCVIDRVPRDLDRTQTESLLALSRMVVAQMELRLAKDHAEAADKAKMRFLANMSHEIRTPLNAILGLSEVMSVEAYGPLGDDRYGEFVSDIHGAGNHLLGLIDEVLDYAAVEGDHLKLKEAMVDPDAIVDSVMRMLAVHSREKGIELTASVPDGLPLVLADEQRLRQVLINLGTNAIKFTPAGGRVELRVSTTPAGGMQIVVSDTGIGMTADELDVALTPFGQIEGDVAMRSGSGLGLPITKRLVESHGGILQLSSSPGGGTEATMTLPAARVIGAAA